MGLQAAAEGLGVKIFLKKLVDGNTGSTILGVIGAAVLASGVNYGDLFSADQNKKATAVGMIAGAGVTAVWGYYIGRKPATPAK
jgi:hypothetical protein